MSEVSRSSVNPTIKFVAEKVGDRHFARAASHGFRRGAACDMARAGHALADNLPGGDWKSRAFKVYLESIRGDLNSRSMVQLLGDHSESEAEMA